MNIYIIRHGETNSNKKGEYYGRLDAPLNEKGRLQMKNLSQSFSQVAFDHVYSSHSSRTLESLKICGEHLYEKAQRDERLSELDFGNFEGKTYREITAIYPQETITWENDWKNFCPPGGESFISFYNRVISFFKEILELKINELKEQNILIMAHSGVIKAVYCYILQNNLDLYWNFSCHNGKINLIKYEYGNLFIDGINRGRL